MPAVHLAAVAPGSATHLVAAAVCGLAMLSASLIGMRLPPAAERRFRACWVGFVVLWQLAAIAWYLLPRNFDIALALPIHICDLIVWMVPLALLTHWRLPREMLFFWGLGLSTIAFVYPQLNAGPMQWNFWLFWVGHTQIVGSAIYLVAATPYRPSIRGWLIASLALIVYAAAVVPINIVFDLDYGYLGPESPTEILGPWPWRLLVILGGSAAVFLVLALPWQKRKPEITR